MHKRNGRAPGFTLIELLVVISIIAILSVIGSGSFTVIKDKIQDAKMRADIDAISKAYEVGRNDETGKYKPLRPEQFTGGKIPQLSEGVDYPGLISSDSEGFNVCVTQSDGSPYCRQSTQGNYVAAGGGVSASGVGPTPTPGGRVGAAGVGGGSPAPVTKKVYLLIFNPIIESRSNQRLTQVMGWGDSVALSNQIALDLKIASHDYIDYQIVNTNIVDGYPVKPSGYQYTDQSFLDCWSDRSKCNSDIMNYQRTISDYGLCEKRNRDEIDEVWMWGAPYFGFWEANMAGPGAFDTNSGPTTGTSCTKLLSLMGFNYERGESEALEDFSHRTEGTMRRVYGTDGRSNYGRIQNNNWSKFALLYNDGISIGGQRAGGCGVTHLAVNAAGNPPDYVNYLWADMTSVNSYCEDFANYPNLTFQTVPVNCTAWGCNSLGYFKWWFSHLPRFEGTGPDGKLNNWWEYIVNPQAAI